jgi:adenylate cyclase
MRRTSVSLLDTYLGKITGERVLNGLIKRGDGDDIYAVIWFCDLRESTPLAETMSREDFLGLLNNFFDTTAGAVLDHGGEVLRFIGDAALAIFPITEQRCEGGGLECNAEIACRNALAAAQDARARIAELNNTREQRGRQPLKFGLALHLGDVTYGNIGAAERLEFTVIGAAANEAARIEALCKTLDESILISDQFVHTFPGNYRSLGLHRLRGVSGSHEIFTLLDQTPG